MQCTRTVRCAVLLAVITLAVFFLLILWLFNTESRTGLNRTNRFIINLDQIRSTPRKFAIENDLLFPNQAVVIQPQDFKYVPWFIPLTEFLTQTTSKQITVVEATYDFLPVLLNWLISACVKTQPPLENILVVALDEKLHGFLQPFRDVHSVYVNPWSVIKSGTKIRSKFSHIWVARLCVFRLLNHWGFDVVHYDADAIVLKNLQPIFDEYRDTDIIGSIGKYPFDLGREWGQTLCMGMALLRSNERTGLFCYCLHNMYYILANNLLFVSISVELFWEGVSTTNTTQFDDQVRFNQALHECGVTWNTHSTKEALITGQCTRLANCSDSCDEEKLLRVAILPETIVCRHCNVEMITSYYVWHAKSSRKSQAKKENAESANVWFLKPRWNDTQENSVESLSL